MIKEGGFGGEERKCGGFGGRGRKNGGFCRDRKGMKC